MQLPAGKLQLLDILYLCSHIYTIDYIIGLPLSSSYNTIFTVVDKITKFIYLIPRIVGKGTLSAIEVV